MNHLYLIQDHIQMPLHLMEDIKQYKPGHKHDHSEKEVSGEYIMKFESLCFFISDLKHL